MTQERTYGISELAQEFGITARAIRFYEDKGLLTPLRDGQRRIYNGRDRVRLMLILRGKRLGFSLREIQEIIDLYHAERGEAGQLRYFLGKMQERRDSLLSQREDIDLTLRELDSLEEQCRALLDRAEAE
ncbi:MerR family transcriptional regulator [Novispirillum sp. DQ9]|uniref:MerR family transcriptional regulator n=1 Tax=Novispirillum sp. DQ9 TaxID=3398612 RepID=UPI003C7CD121